MAISSACPAPPPRPTAAPPSHPETPRRRAREGRLQCRNLKRCCKAFTDARNNWFGANRAASHFSSATCSPRVSGRDAAGLRETYVKACYQQLRPCASKSGQRTCDHARPPRRIGGVEWAVRCYQCQTWSYWENRLGSSLLLTSSKSLTKLLREIPRVSTSSRTTWTGIPPCFILSRSLWG